MTTSGGEWRTHVRRAKGRSEVAADSGLTLIELVVAITLLGLLMAALFGGLQLGARAWERSEARLDQSTRLQVVHDFLRNRLVQAYPLGTEDEAGRPQPTFQGSAEELRFVTPMPEHLGAGFAEFVIALDDRLDARNLIVRWRPYDWLAAGSGADDEAQTKVLLEGIEALEIGYYGVPDRAQSASWHDQWDSPGAIPQLIRIRIDFAAEDHRYWPELVIRPMVDTVLTVL